MEKITGLLILVSLLIFGIYFLDKGKLNSGYFTVYMCVVLICGLAFYGFDRLKELDLKNFKLILNEIKTVKDDVYAKAATVKKIGEEVAEFTSFSVITVGRFVGDDLQEKMLEARDRIKVLLKELGSEEQKIESLVIPIEKMVLHDLASKMINPVAGKIQEIKIQRSEKVDSNEIWGKLRAFFNDYTEEELISYLKYLEHEGIDLKLIDSEIKNYRKFLKIKELQ